MASYTCSQGHRWSSAASGRSAAQEQPLCPVCGEVPLVEAAVAEPLPKVEPAPVPWAAVELPPDLPALTFVSMEVWNPERIGALAIYCSDGRWGDAFDEFCHRSLHLPRYDRFAVPGGPAWLAEQHSQRPDLVRVAREQLEFLVGVHRLERVVLITHYACAFYTERLHQSPNDCLPVQLEDVGKAADIVREWFPSVAVDCYLAMRTGNRLSFHQVRE